MVLYFANQYIKRSMQKEEKEEGKVKNPSYKCIY